MAIPIQKLEGKYEILEKIREGGMGAIYRVRHRLLGEERVVKVMRPHLQKDPELQSRFLAEARAATQLSHPNIAQIFDCTVDEDGFAYIVMELIRGKSLHEVLASDSLLPVPVVLEIARQGLRALSHIHQQSIAHRDISPDNLMLTRDVEGQLLVKVIDLGVAKDLEGGGPATGTGVFLGKLRYAAPETFDDTGGIDRRRCDLYAFGLVLFELLTGRFPISGDTPSSLIAGHLFRPPLSFSEADPERRVPEAVRATVLQALAKHPDERHHDAAGFAAALGQPPQSPSAAEVDALLRPASPSLVTRSLPPPGSTQSRFDRQFTAELTPLPAAGGTEPNPRDLTTQIDPGATRVLPTEPESKRLLPTGDAGRGVSAEPGVEGSGTHATRILPTFQLHIARARQASRQQAFDEAVAALEQAQALEPNEPQIGPLLEEARRAARQQHALAERERAVSTHVASISALIRADDLDAAELELLEAGESWGRDPRWSALREQLATRRNELDQARSLQADDLVERARSYAQTENFEAARKLLQSALALVADHAQARSLLGSVEACLAAREQETHDLAEVDRTITGIRAALDDGRPADALVDLNQAAARYGDRQALRELRYETAQAQLDAAASEEQPVQRLPPSSPTPVQVAADPAAVEKVVERLRTLRDGGRAGEALKELNLAVREFGELPVLQTLRYELGEALLQRDAKEEETASEMFEAVGQPTARGGLPAQSAKPSAAAAAPPAKVAGQALGVTEPALSTVAPSASPASLPGLQDATLRSTSGIELPERPGPPETHSNRSMIAVGFLVAALLGLAIYLLSRQGSIRQEEIEVQDVVAAKLSPGFLVVDAAPWGEIVELENPALEDQPLLKPSAYTPVRLELPPGDYRVVVVYPPTGQSETREVSVDSDQRVEERFEFTDFEADEYFEKIGW